MMEPVLRTVIKIPADATLQEAKEIIADVMKIPVEEVSITVDEYEQQQNGRIKLRQFMEPLYSELRAQNTANSNKKADELIVLAKFTYSTKEDIKILECCDPLDFIAEHKGEKIGIELVSVYNSEVAAEISEIKKVIQAAKEIVLRTRSQLTGLYNIFLSGKIISGNKAMIMTGNKPEKKAAHDEKGLWSSEIANYISSVEDGKVIEKPAIIEEITSAANFSVLDFALAEEYWLEKISKEQIAEIISKKGALVGSYIALHKIQKLWLLIVIDGASSKSSFQMLLDNLPQEETLFDRIFIFNVFSGEFFTA